MTVRRAPSGRSGLPRTQPYVHHAVSERVARQRGQPDDVETRPRRQLPLIRPARLARAAGTGTKQWQSRRRVFIIRQAAVVRSYTPGDCDRRCLPRITINFTVHFINFIKNNSANGRWPEAPIAAAICLFTVIWLTPFVSVSWIIWCCHLADQFVLYYFLYLSVLTYSYGELNCDRLHILITFIYIITPLLTSTHKPVLARDPSSYKNN